MRGTLLPAMPSRIKGQGHLVHRLRRLTLIAYRYARGRARTRAEQRWAATLIDGLEDTLRAVGAATATGPTNNSHHGPESAGAKCCESVDPQGDEITGGPSTWPAGAGPRTRKERPGLTAALGALAFGD